jgi:fructokinase
MQLPVTAARHLVIGEVVADVVHTHSSAPVTHPGGSPANVAVGLSRLGMDVTLMTQIGRDPHGDLIRAHLDESGVEVLSVPGLEGLSTATPSAIAHLDSNGAATYEFNIAWTFPPAAPPCTPLHVHTGSLAALMTPGADSVESLIRDLRETSSISFDPNIRPALVQDRVAAVNRVERMIALSDVAKASDEDIAYLYPGLDPVQAALEWLQLGPGIVVVTLGANGSVCVTRDGIAAVEPTVVTVADTVGAGDSFMATLIDGLTRVGLLGAARRAALAALTTQTAHLLGARASRAAAITVSRPGAAPPTLDELDAFR